MYTQYCRTCMNSGSGICQGCHNLTGGPSAYSGKYTIGVDFKATQSSPMTKPKFTDEQLEWIIKMVKGLKD